MSGPWTRWRGVVSHERWVLVVTLRWREARWVFQHLLNFPSSKPFWRALNWKTNKSSKPCRVSWIREKVRSTRNSKSRFVVVVFIIIVCTFSSVHNHRIRCDIWIERKFSGAVIFEIARCARFSPYAVGINFNKNIFSFKLSEVQMADNLWQWVVNCSSFSVHNQLGPAQLFRGFRSRTIELEMHRASRTFNYAHQSLMIRNTSCAQQKQKKFFLQTREWEKKTKSNLMIDPLGAHYIISLINPASKFYYSSGKLYETFCYCKVRVNEMWDCVVKLTTLRLRQ